AELWNVTRGGRIGSLDLNDLTHVQITYFVVQHHHRFRAEQATGIQRTVGNNVSISCVCHKTAIRSCQAISVVATARFRCSDQKRSPLPLCADASTPVPPLLPVSSCKGRSPSALAFHIRP